MLVPLVRRGGETEVSGWETTGKESVAEIQQIFAADDFGEAASPELREARLELEEQMSANAKR